MLERTTACLKSGAVRDSLRSVQQVPRSKRALHSAFWSHGAGDLDIPPWALSTLSIPPEPRLKSDDTRWRHQQREKSMGNKYLGISNAGKEGPYLDFLYPPQALAWLRKANTQYSQRWERRNARRLPEGFIVASRGYASRSSLDYMFTGAASTEEQSVDNSLNGEHEGGDGELQPNNLNHSQGSKEGAKDQQEQVEKSIRGTENWYVQSDSTIPYNPKWQETHGTNGRDPGEGTNDPQRDAELRKSRNKSSKTVALDSSLDTEFLQHSAFVDSPADIPEHISSQSRLVEDLLTEGANSEDASSRLREIMALSRSGLAKNSRELTNKAMSVYDALEEKSRNDLRLKKELIEWLSVQHNDTALERCVEMYRSLPVRERTLQTYQAALNVFLARHDFQAATKLHRSALFNIENGDQISRTLFRYAVKTQHWPLAIRTEKAHYQRYLRTDIHNMHANEASKIRIFWLHVSEIPQLLLKAIQLAKFLSSKDGARLLDDHTRNFAAKFFRVAVSQEFVQPDGVRSFKALPWSVSLPTRHIRRLVGHIVKIEEDTSKFLEEVLMGMLRPDSRFHYSQLHHAVSFIYAKYRSRLDARPPKQLFMLWLERLTEYSDKLAKLRSTLHSMSIDDLVKEWERHYDHLSKEAVNRLMMFYARSGELESYERWLEYLRSVYPEYETQKDILWTMIWVHARRADLDRAQQAFAEVKRITSENGDMPNILCWNLLLQAHSRADDLAGAFTNLQNMIDHGKLIPDQYSFHHVLQMLAKRGDVEGVEDLLLQYDRIADRKRETAHLGSLLLAHINNDDVQTAEKLLQEAIPRVRDGAIRGSLVGCFNLVMTACALRRDIDATRLTYRWMKDEGVVLDANSYAAIMQALAFYRQTQQAYGILTRVMPANDVEPTAFHYGILIAGFVNNHQYQMALEVHNRMVRMNIKPSSSTITAYLKAKAIAEHRRVGRRRMQNGEAVPLEDTIKEMKKMLRVTDGAKIASKQPGLGFGSGTLNLAEAPAAYFDFLIFIHGQRRCFEAVKELHQQYKDGVKPRDGEPDSTPIRLLATFASASWRYGQHEDVEQCWHLAKEQADDTAPLVPVPQLKILHSDNQSSTDVAADSTIESESEGLRSSADEGYGSSVTQKQTLLLDKQAPRPRAPAPGRRHILSRVLRYYLLSLQSQGRAADAINTVSQVISQGYTMDNRTWNTFIESICRMSPPLALLAFVLAERFLTPHFPGWSPVVEYPPRREAIAQGLQYIKARYLAPGQLMLQYRTSVWMGAALVELKKLRAQGYEPPSFNVQPGLERYVGSVKLIRRYAPKTLFIVQNIPRVRDDLQSRVLGLGDS